MLIGNFSVTCLVFLMLFLQLLAMEQNPPGRQESFRDFAIRVATDDPCTKFDIDAEVMIGLEASDSTCERAFIALSQLDMPHECKNGRRPKCRYIGERDGIFCSVEMQYQLSVIPWVDGQITKTLSECVTQIRLMTTYMSDQKPKRPFHDICFRWDKPVTVQGAWKDLPKPMYGLEPSPQEIQEKQTQNKKRVRELKRERKEELVRQANEEWQAKRAKIGLPPVEEGKEQAKRRKPSRKRSHKHAALEDSFQF